MGRHPFTPFDLRWAAAEFLWEQAGLFRVGKAGLTQADAADLLLRASEFCTGVTSPSGLVHGQGFCPKHHGLGYYESE